MPRRGAWLAFCCALWGAAAAALVAWALAHLGADGGPAAAASFVTAAALGWRGLHVDAGALRWDGACWTFDGEAGSVEVVCDLDRWLLLRFHGAQGRRAWLAVGRRSAAGAWHTLRAAVYSRRSDDKPA